MAVSVASFKSQLPEFVKVPDEMIAARLEEAVRNVDPEIFGDKTDDAVRWYAAHLIAGGSQFGQHARLKGDKGDTIYRKRYLELARSMTPGFRVA